MHGYWRILILLRIRIYSLPPEQWKILSRNFKLFTIASTDGLKSISAGFLLMPENLITLEKVTKSNRTI